MNKQSPTIKGSQSTSFRPEDRPLLKAKFAAARIAYEDGENGATHMERLVLEGYSSLSIKKVGSVKKSYLENLVTKEIQELAPKERDYVRFLLSKN